MTPSRETFSTAVIVLIRVPPVESLSPL